MAFLTAAALGLQGLGYYQNRVDSKKREAEYRGEATQQKTALEASRNAIKNIDFSPGSGIYELEQNRKLQAELLGSNAQRRGDEKEARAIASFQDSPRMGQAMLPRLLEQTEQAQQKVDLQTGNMMTEAEATTTKAEEAGIQKGRERDLMLGQLDFQRAGKSFDSYMEGAYGERASQAQALQAMLSETGETLVALEGSRKKDGGGDDTVTPTDNTVTPTVDTRSGFDIDYGQPNAESYSTQKNPIFRDDFEGEFTQSELDLIDGNAYKDGGYIGKQGGVTEGEFDHDTNKIALVDQESGEIVGEGTGGEAFLNPNQFKNLTEAKALLKKLSASSSASQEIKKAAELLKFLEGEQFQDA